MPVSSMDSHLEAVVQHQEENTIRLRYAVSLVGAFVQHQEENAVRLSTSCMWRCVSGHACLDLKGDLRLPLSRDSRSESSCNAVEALAQ